MCFECYWPAAEFQMCLTGVFGVLQCFSTAGLIMPAQRGTMNAICPEVKGLENGNSIIFPLMFFLFSFSRWPYV